MNGKSFDERKQRTNEKIDRRNASEKFSHSDFCMRGALFIIPFEISQGFAENKTCMFGDV